MSPTRAAVLRLEHGACRAMNRASQTPLWRGLFQAVSRLGDGGIWYALILVLPLVAGAKGLRASGTMLATGLACTLLYKAIKAVTRRPRPLYAMDDLTPVIPPLDEFSFPSGHTMHAVAFTLLATTWFPVLAVFLVPFTILVALSRLVLALHYPSDVIAGAAIGLTMASAALNIAT